jgi:putative Mg2+ transporter-C (MgtC) family protein
MDHFVVSNFDMVIRLTVAMLLGGLIGTERLFAGKTAGVRTFSLVSMGSAVFVLVGIYVTGWYVNSAGSSFDPMRMASQIVVGIGFLGAGLIIFRNEKLSGLTTAAGLWLSAGIGVSVGFGLFDIGIVATLLTLFIFIVLGFLKRKLENFSSDLHHSTEHDDES